MARKSKLTPVDMSLITPEKLAKIKLEAKKTVELRKLKEAEEALLAREIEALEHENDPVYEKRHLLIDLAPHSHHIMIDGTFYHQGHTYEVATPVYETLLEMISRSWEHEDHVGGANRGSYVKPRNTHINGRTMQTTNRPGMSF